MLFCNICHEKPIIPIELQCGHNFCFLCVVPSMLEMISENICPSMCNTQNNCELFNEKKPVHSIDFKYYVWLYSSNYGNTWWCYQRETCEQVEKIYNDYCLRQQILNDNSTSKNNINLTLTQNTTKKPKQTLLPKSFAQLDTASNDSNENDDAVDFNSISSSDYNGQEETNNTNHTVSYIVNIHGTSYKLDFDAMKQINLTDTTKKRSVKRIVVPNEKRNCSANEIKQYLMNTHSILGVAGKKF